MLISLLPCFSQAASLTDGWRLIETTALIVRALTLFVAIHTGLKQILSQPERLNSPLLSWQNWPWINWQTCVTDCRHQERWCDTNRWWYLTIWFGVITRWSWLFGWNRMGSILWPKGSRNRPATQLSVCYCSKDASIASVIWASCAWKEDASPSASMMTNFLSRVVKEIQ